MDSALMQQTECRVNCEAREARESMAAMTLRANCARIKNLSSEIILDSSPKINSEILKREEGNDGGSRYLKTG
jgi:hypothetical protein